MKLAIRALIEKAYNSTASAEGWAQANDIAFDVTVPKEEKHGDFSCNAAMILASKLKTNPRAIALKLAARLEEEALFSSVKVAGAGFINMTVQPLEWVSFLGAIISEKEKFGSVDIGKGRKVMIEFVSANPTGPLHIGHGRGAAVGDALARILEKAGYDTHKEYYINDVGLQMENLGRSTINRAKELLGKPFDAPDYKGEYIKDIAKEYIACKGEDVLELPPAEAVLSASEFTADSILKGIRRDLDDFDVKFDKWFSEESLHSAGAVESTIEKLQADGHIYEKDGALWLSTESAGDEKDRVVRRANGITTYLAADIAYHKDKFDRGFETVVDVWGADHHGYIPRMKATVSALGLDPDRLVVRLVQLVSLKRGGKTVAMTTRGGVFTTLREIIDEVGVDVTRYFFLMRSADSHLDFDVDLAKKHSDENPVFYIQYAHARCANIFVTASEKGVKNISFDELDKSLLNNKDEVRLIRKLSQLPGVVASCAEGFQPHPVTQYLTETAAAFHYFYRHNRVVTDDVPLTQARLKLVEATMITLKNGLALLGISAPTRM